MGAGEGFNRADSLVLLLIHSFRPHLCFLSDTVIECVSPFLHHGHCKRKDFTQLSVTDSDMSAERDAGTQ